MPSKLHERGFWTSTAVFCLFLLAAGVPSPLYARYAERWHFSSALLTLIFAVYAVALLAALLLLGDLSDAMGRRPVIFAALALLLLGLGVFIGARSVAWLIVARLLQGFATGMLTAAASASMLDLEPGGRPGLAALASVIAAMAGQAAGALGSGALVQYAPDPLRLVYVVVLVAVLAVGVAAVRAIPETVATRRRFAARIQVAVPHAVRPAFLAATPCLIATWALNSFYLSLGPSLTLTLDAGDNRLIGVTAPAILLGAGTLSAIAARERDARTRMLGGCAVLAAGAALTVLALALRNVQIFYASTFVAGLGLGTAFSGALQVLSGLAEGDDRGALVAAIYVVAYLSFSVPAVIAGVLSNSIGLMRTATGFISVIAVLAVTALIATVRATRELAPATP